MGSYGVAVDAKPMRAPQLVDLAVIQATGELHSFLSPDTHCILHLVELYNLTQIKRFPEPQSVMT